MMLTTPTILTLLRVAAIPFIAVLFFVPDSWGHNAAAGLYVVASITDWLDGYLARRWNQMSAFGAFLDPVADKLIVSTALVLLVAYDPSPMLAFLVAVIIGREITISALREWMAELGERTSVAVSWIGKLKTTFQMVAIIGMLWRDTTLGIPFYDLGYFLLACAAGLTLWSMLVYLRAAWPLMSGQSQETAASVSNDIAEG